MKINVTSQDELIDIAKRVLLKEGIDALSIRRLAKECDISVGVFYNYFETKADLIFAIVSSFWKGVMETSDLAKQNNICDFVDILYTTLVDKLEEFEETWLMQMSLLNYTEKQKGKELEQQCFSHIMNEMIIVMNRDKQISKNAFDDLLTQESITHFILMNIISMARGHCHNCEGLVEILKRVLYK